MQAMHGDSTTEGAEIWLRQRRLQIILGLERFQSAWDALEVH
jgi:hypothetical protein